MGRARAVTRGAIRRRHQGVERRLGNEPSDAPRHLRRFAHSTKRLSAVDSFRSTSKTASSSAGTAKSLSASGREAASLGPTSPVPSIATIRCSKSRSLQQSAFRVGMQGWRRAAGEDLPHRRGDQPLSPVVVRRGGSYRKIGTLFTGHPAIGQRGEALVWNGPQGGPDGCVVGAPTAPSQSCVAPVHAPARVVRLIRRFGRLRIRIRAASSLPLRGTGIRVQRRAVRSVCRAAVGVSSGVAVGAGPSALAPRVARAAPELSPGVKPATGRAPDHGAATFGTLRHAAARRCRWIFHSRGG